MGDKGQSRDIKGTVPGEPERKAKGMVLRCLLASLPRLPEDPLMSYSFNSESYPNLFPVNQATQFLLLATPEL